MVVLQWPWRCKIEGTGVLCLKGAMVNACEGRSIGFRVQFWSVHGGRRWLPRRSWWR